MPAHMTVRKGATTAGLDYTISFVDRAGLDSLALEAQLKKVWADVNPCNQLPPGAADYQTQYNRGPLLFNEAAIDLQTRASLNRLGGLQVSADLLDATVAKLRALGFTVDD